MGNENLITIVIDKERLELMSKRFDERIARLQKLKESGDISTHGNWDLGYFEGRTSVFEDILAGLITPDDKHTGYIKKVIV